MFELWIYQPSQEAYRLWGILEEGTHFSEYVLQELAAHPEIPYYLRVCP